MAPTSAPKVSNLSEEYIQDSDEDDEAETANVATPKSSPAKTSAKQSAGSSKIDKVARQAKTPLEREEVDGEEEEDGEEDDGEEDDDDEEVAEADEEDGEDDDAGAAGMVDEAADDRPRAFRKASKKPKAVYEVPSFVFNWPSLTLATVLLCLETFRLNHSNPLQGLRGLSSIYQMATPDMRTF